MSSRPTSPRTKTRRAPGWVAGRPFGRAGAQRVGGQPFGCAPTCSPTLEPRQYLKVRVQKEIQSFTLGFDFANPSLRSSVNLRKYYSLFWAFSCFGPFSFLMDATLTTNGQV